LTAPWPSARPSTGRAGKAPKARTIRTGWLSGWVIALSAGLVAGGMGALASPFVARALDVIQQLSDALQTTN